MNWVDQQIKTLSNALVMDDSFDGLEKQSPNRIVTPSSLIIIDNDLMITYTNADSEFSDESANQNLEAIWDIVKDRSIFHLIVPDETTHITLEARDYNNPKFESIKKAEAIVIKTLAHRLLAQFYLKARKGKGYPIRIFDSEVDARSWFASLK